jgi:asparagine synthase (glutamine-hydrolysing)
MIVFTRSAIEVRCPFFDYNFVNFIYSLPEYIRTSPKFYRTVITRRMPHLAMVPNEKDNRLPHINPLIYHSYGTLQRGESWINRNVGQVFPQPGRTRLYADYENYLRNELRDWAETILFAQGTQERGLFNTKALKTLWQDHLEGNEQWTIGKIAPLITLEMVLSEFYDKKLPEDTY